MKGIRRS